MKSKITIEIDFENNQPTIQIKSVLTEDVRDKLIRTFFQRLGSDSSWCKVEFLDPYDNEEGERVQYINLNPIPETQLESMIREAQGRIKTLQ